MYQNDLKYCRDVNILKIYVLHVQQTSLCNAVGFPAASKYIILPMLPLRHGSNTDTNYYFSALTHKGN